MTGSKSLGFGFEFKGVQSRCAIPLNARPRQSLGAPDYGWMDWHFVWPHASDVVQFSYINAPAHVWVWGMALAHRLLPATLRVNEEGRMAELCVDWLDEGLDTVRITLRRLDNWGRDEDVELAGGYTWADRRGRWLLHLGLVFGRRMADFPPEHWGFHSPLWVPIETFLPWHRLALPVVQPGLCSLQPSVQRQAWFFAALALGLDVMSGQPVGTSGWMFEQHARLVLQETRLRHHALMAALALLGVDDDVASRDGYESASTELAESFEDSDELYHQMLSNADTVTHWPTTEPELPTGPLLQELKQAFLIRLEFLRQVARQAFTAWSPESFNAPARP